MADPIGANFFGVIIPKGVCTVVDRVLSIGTNQEYGNTLLTRSNDTESLAELRSRVSIMPEYDPQCHRT
jgi:hypothetical protein